MGILKYANQHDWDIRILQNVSELTSEAVKEAVRLKNDGIINGLMPDSMQTIELLNKSSQLATVCFDLPEYACNRKNSGLITSDNQRAGKLAAEHLLSLGRFNSYAFFADRLQRRWAKNRERGFLEVLHKAGFSCKIFMPSDDFFGHENTPPRAELVSWLRSIPKPAAVLAACDYLAIHILEACNDADIRVPQSVAILGMDNDEPICEGHRPALSSIDLGFEQQGYLAAEMLDKMMSGKRAIRSCVATEIKVVVRESTRPLTPASALVSRAQSFISAEACKGIDAQDVANFLGVSRRLSDLRFSEIVGNTVSAKIERVRLEKAREYLVNTRRTISWIAHAVGYNGANYFTALFKKRLGKTPREWRTIHSSPSNGT